MPVQWVAEHVQPRFVMKAGELAVHLPVAGSPVPAALSVSWEASCAWTLASLLICLCSRWDLQRFQCCPAEGLLKVSHLAADDDTWLDAAALVDTLRGLCQSPDCADEKIYLGGKLREAR